MECLRHYWLRVTSDVWDEQRCIDECFDAWRKWQGKEQPGFWIDMDMIPFGNLQLMSPPSKDPKKTVMSKGDIALAGKGVRRHCQLNREQMKTFITMRALAASPLMMGGDLPTLDEYSYSLITNPDMLACNQNGVMGSLILEKSGLETWKTAKKGSSVEGWVGVFNRSDREVEFDLSPERLGLDGLDGTHYGLKDVWRNEEIVFGQAVRLKPHGVILVEYDRSK